MLLIVYPGKCQDCGAEVPLSEAKYGREQVSAGCERIFRRCPHCGAEIEDVIRDVRDERKD